MDRSAVVMPAVSYALASDQVHLAYSRLGAGPPLLVAAGPMLSCQPGVLSNARAYAFLRILSQRYELILFDERGTGSSGGGLEGRDASSDAGDLEAVVRAAEIENYHLVSGFASSAAALELAAAQPENVTRVVLWAPLQRGCTLFESPQAQAILALAEIDPLLAFRVLTHTLAGWDTGLVPAYLGGIFRDTYGLSGLESWLRQVEIPDERLQEVQADTLIMHPSEAALLDIDRSRHLTAAIPKARMMLVEGQSIVPYAGDVENAAQMVIDALNPASSVGLAAPDWGTEGGAVPGTLEAPLTSRERDVLRLIASGDSSKEIAAQLDISVNTVDRHISNIYRKLGVRGRAQAAAYAVKQGIS